ncbi:three-Cys-motif partner protein TcmP [Micromonospora sp. WMMA1363]|uniref:three-Cys-motif partner protein TcmP n=1 Tax=Micromonospora sp. WMMA1363 TaxID=3053985 RepID=UPI00259C8549|nr:three-Cys-motif partner protein TcmP [Micromonospora sp. WMMA1363]MDM4720119.1 three-Cys-motif partner protein TcmP [Micromonospora sp. WMMA1363]MDM4722979.1 three-Cys-motif partner protein TcmP [Micromonospora sp. WMMA1363]
MSSNDDFFATKKAAAVFKHGILSRYPVVFAAKAGMNVRDHRVTFLDGYAGQGRYGDGEPGSPLLLVESARQVESFRSVRGIFVERNDANFENLSQVLSEVECVRKPVLFHRSLDDCLPEILDLVKEDALFAFLDPFGPALDFNLIRSGLLSRPERPPTEVLLHISVSTVARMGGQLRTARADGKPLTGSPLATAQRLNRFLGGDWWQEHFATVSDKHDDYQATQAALTVADKYRDMIAAGTGFMSMSMPVRPRPDLLPKYVLALFTRHVEGVWCFADALGKAGADWRRACTAAAWNRGISPDQPTLFDLEMLAPGGDVTESANNRDWIATIAANILHLATTVGPFRIADRVTDVYGDTLGSAWIPHVRSAVQDLHRQGLIANDGKGKRFHYALIRRY